VRWFHPLTKMLSMLARVIVTLVKAVVQTIRQRHAHPPTTEKHGDERAIAPTSATAGTAAPVHPRDRTANREERPTEIVVDGVAIHMPKPSIWPAVVGLGTAMSLFGIVTSLGFSFAGLLVLIAGLGGWIGELHHEHG